MPRTVVRHAAALHTESIVTVVCMALVAFEKKDFVLRVALNRVSALNAVNSSLLQELEAGLSAHAADPEIRVLMLSGRGGCFASGADIKELAGFDQDGIRNFHDLRERTFALLETFPSPTLAVIERYALGTGLELALCCDFRIAAADAMLGVPSAKLGIVESYEYVSRLVRAVGPHRAKKMLLTGEKVDAQTALANGLIEEVVASDALFVRADAIAAAICSNSVYSMRQSKQVVEICCRDPDLLRVGDKAAPMIRSLQNPDFKEGVAAFLGKRPAKFE
jgi:enoyl-CoA hydratase/carnithine racemase